MNWENLHGLEIACPTKKEMEDLLTFLYHEQLKLPKMERYGAENCTDYVLLFRPQDKIILNLRYYKNHARVTQKSMSIHTTHAMSIRDFYRKYCNQIDLTTLYKET